MQRLTPPSSLLPTAGSDLISGLEAGKRTAVSAIGIEVGFGGSIDDLTGMTLSPVSDAKRSNTFDKGVGLTLAGSISVLTSAGITSQTFTYTSSTPSNQWVGFSLDFVDTETSIPISVLGTYIQGGHHIGLDNLSIEPIEQNLIQNGSFEDATTFEPNIRDAMSIDPGSQVIPNWTTANAEIAWIYNVNRLGPKPLVTPFGNYFLDLTGFHDSSPYGGISQSINTIPGEAYTLSFDLGVYNGPADPSLAGPVSVLASAGTTSQTFTYNSSSRGNQWGEFSLGFVATETSTPISILGTYTQGGHYIGLDNVSVAPSPLLSL